MRKLIATFLLAAAAAFPVASRAATTWGTDFSDMWLAAGEDGWGANVIHQGDTLFLTLYVYGPDSQVRWYTSGAQSLGASAPSTFGGDLYETTGPYFGGPFNPSSVAYRKVGTASFAARSTNTADLVYTVDNVRVTKTIGRYLFRYNSLAGNFRGALVAESNTCGLPAVEEATFAITQTGTAVAIDAQYFHAGRCNYAATYSQAGRMGALSGTVLCNNGASGTFEAYEIEAGKQGLLARYTTRFANGCLETGHFGGVKY
jgi:hypothetical protein